MEENEHLSDENQKDRATRKNQPSSDWAFILGKLGGPAIRWGALSYLGYKASSTSIYFASQTDSFVAIIESSAISIPNDSNISWIWCGLFGLLGIGVGIFGVIYGFVQSQLRRKSIEYLAERKVSLEREIDPDRSSSGLTKSGDTPREET